MSLCHLGEPRSIGGMTTPPKKIGILGYPDSEILDIAGPLSAFDSANKTDDRAARSYETLLLAVEGDRVECSCGVALSARNFSAEPPDSFDTVLVAGGYGVARVSEYPDALEWLRPAARAARRTGSVCSGAVVLAEAGLLDGRRATTHWRWCADIARRFPRVRFDPDPIFIRDGNVFTSAGVTAGIDLSLALIEEDLGADRALAVARNLVVFLRRPGGQSQFSVSLSHQTTAVPAFRTLHGWIMENLGRPLTVESLAERAGMSPRHFSRVFTREMGVSPGQFVLQLRLEAARRRLEESSQPLKQIAGQCGFANTEALRSAFQRSFRTSPVEYRKRFQPSSISPKGISRYDASEF